MAKVYQVAIEVKTKPDSVTMKKMGKQLEQVVEKSFSTPFRAGSRVLRHISAGLKKGIRGAVEGAFKMSGSVMGFFKGISSAIEEPLHRIKEVLGIYDEIDQTAVSLGLTKNQVLFLKDFAHVSGGKSENLFHVADKIFNDLSDENNSILAQHGISRSKLEEHGKDPMSLLMSTLQIMGSQTEENQRYFSRLFFGEREFARIKPFLQDATQMQQTWREVDRKIVKPAGNPLVEGSSTQERLHHLNQEAVIQQRIEERKILMSGGLISKSAESEIISLFDSQLKSKLAVFDHLESAIKTLKTTEDMIRDFKEVGQEILDTLHPALEPIKDVMKWISTSLIGALNIVKKLFQFLHRFVTSPKEVLLDWLGFRNHKGDSPQPQGKAGGYQLMK